VPHNFATSSPRGPLEVGGPGRGTIESQAIPITLGAGTNQDAVIALSLQETPIFIGPIQFAASPGRAIGHPPGEALRVQRREPLGGRFAPGLSG
jgi:hypothetical protein